MSFLLLHHEDEHATLEAALAFLDSCGDDGNDEGPTSPLTDLSTDVDTTCSSDEPECAVSSDISSGSSSSSSMRDTNLRTDKGSSVHRNHAHNDTSARNNQQIPTVVKRVRKRVVVEITELRAVVRQLAVRLDQLQTRRAIVPSRVIALTSINAKERSRAREDAMMALEKLRKSTAVNRQLRAAWKKQIKLAKKLENLIAKQLAVPDVESLDMAKSGKRTISAGENPTIQVDTSCFVQLRWYLESMYQQTAPICASISIKQDTSRVFSSSCVHHDPLLGDVFECTTNTPVACSVQDLDVHVRDLLLNEKAMKKKPSVVNYVTHELPNRPTSLEHQFTQNFDCQFGGILVHGVSVSHKYEDSHCRVLAYTSLLTLEGTDLTFRETGWLIFREQSDNGDDFDPKGSRTSLLQGCYRIHREETASNAADLANVLEDGAYFQNFIHHSQCEEMRTKQLHLQAAVLQRFGSSMSFLLAEDEDATLEAALAFLDTCADDHEHSDKPHDRSTDLSTRLESAFSSQELEWSSNSDQSSPDTPVNSSDNYWNCMHSKFAAADQGSNAQCKAVDEATTELHQKDQPELAVLRRVRKRGIAEILELRERVSQLTARRSQVEKRTTRTAGLPVSRPEVAEETLRAYSNAVQELEKLHESESMNQKLRNAWQHQIKLAKKLEKIFNRQQGVPADLDSLFEAKSEHWKVESRDDHFVRDETIPLTKLHRYLEPLYRQTASSAASTSLRIPLVSTVAVTCTAIWFSVKRDHNW